MQLSIVQSSANDTASGLMMEERSLMKQLKTVGPVTLGNLCSGILGLKISGGLFR